MWFYYDDSNTKHGPFSDDQARALLSGENPWLLSESPKRTVISIDQKSFSSCCEHTSPIRTVIPINSCEYGMIWFKPGNFLRKGPAPDIDDPDFDEADFDKCYEITISRGFWLLETPVTQAMWSNVMGTNPSYFQGDDLPVEHVSWFDCKAFIEKLNQVAPPEWNFRLPTEAEWEYACGPALNAVPEIDCWYQRNSGGKTHPVKKKKPNAQGLYNMFGNVWEWCEDWSGEFPKCNLVDPKGPESGTERIARGGCWNSQADKCNWFERSRDYPDGSCNVLGFRLASSTPEK